MSYWRILIVEDEQIVARDLQARLKKMKYDAPAIASSVTEAIDLIAEIKPQLILTDIRLGTELDGINLVQIIRADYDTPVIYITAFTDDETLARAKVTEPYGYVVKPFNDRELQIAIEIAIFKNRVERDLKEQRGWLAAILQSIGDAVIATDQDGRIVFMNPAAEVLTCWSDEEARSMDLGVIFNIRERKKFLTPWRQIIPNDNLKIAGLDQSILISKDGKQRPIQSKVSRLKNERGHDMGEVVVFRDVSMEEASLLPVLK